MGTIRPQLIEQEWNEITYYEAFFCADKYYLSTNGIQREITEYEYKRIKNLDLWTNQLK